MAAANTLDVFGGTEGRIDSADGGGSGTMTGVLVAAMELLLAKGTAPNRS